ncbi:barstar family protein [Paracidovorax anthurii]|uniref:barstar family protein n=1 Tax=Paracidovorax anthurii TaxID=78229 RepID=UPI001B86FCA0|nr:barstar family protein [Paracidovorax anthurii]
MESQNSIFNEDHFILKVPAGIGSKTELLAVLASAGHFPEYFGGNWDALEDCLRDLSWISQKEVVILHNDLPLQGTPADCRIYLEVLQTVLADWAEIARPNAAEPPSEWAYVDHDLRIVFPLEAEKTVAKLRGT